MHMNFISDTSIADNCATGEARLLPTNYSCDDCGYIKGRVEVCVNNAWGTICGDSFFSTVDAGVVCGQLGGYFTNNSEIIDGEPGSGPIFLERVECSQEDANILDCPRFSPLGLVSCGHSLDVSIRCAGRFHHSLMFTSCIAIILFLILCRH